MEFPPSFLFHLEQAAQCNVVTEAKMWRQQQKVLKNKSECYSSSVNVGHKKPRGEELSKCQLRLFSPLSLWRTHMHTSITISHPTNSSCTPGLIIYHCAHSHAHTCTDTHSQTHTLGMCSYLYSCYLEPVFSGRHWYINCINIHTLVRVASFISLLSLCKCDCTRTHRHTNTHSSCTMVKHS